MKVESDEDTVSILADRSEKLSATKLNETRALIVLEIPNCNVASLALYVSLAQLRQLRDEIDGLLQK